MDILKAYEITGTTETPEKIIFKLTSKEKIDDVCPYCSSKNIVSHASRTISPYKDIPKKGVYIEFAVTFKRLRCKDCKKLIYQATPYLSNRFNMTTRLIDYIKEKIFATTFSALAKEVGVTEGTIRHFFNDYCDDLKDAFAFSSPKIVFLARIKMANQQRLAVINPDMWTIIDFLRCVSQECISEFAAKHPSVSFVVLETFDRELFGISLSKVYDNVLKTTALGYKAKITAKNLMLKDPPSPEEIKAISSWKIKHPMLYDLHGIKSALIDIIYSSSSSKETADRFDRWYESLPSDHKPLFFDLYQKIHEYGPFAFSWIDIDLAGLTGGKDISEALKAISNSLNAAGGYENARARVLFNKDLHVIDNGINYGVSIKKWLEELK